jgi:hypothetical protein
VPRAAGAGSLRIVAVGVAGHRAVEVVRRIRVVGTGRRRVPEGARRSLGAAGHHSRAEVVVRRTRPAVVVRHRVAAAGIGPAVAPAEGLRTVVAARRRAGPQEEAAVHTLAAAEAAGNTDPEAAGPHKEAVEAAVAAGSSLLGPGEVLMPRSR